MSEPHDADHDTFEQVASARRSSADYRGGHEKARRAFSFGQAVRERRQALGLSQTDVGARAGMTKPALSRLEAGRSVPTIPVLERIALAVGAEPVASLASLAARTDSEAGCAGRSGTPT